jgi:predicted Zn-dependent peptidase
MAVDRSRLPALGPEPSFTFPEIAKQRLPNGLNVWTVEYRSLPVVTFLLLLPVGAAADPSDRPGIAALTGDMLDEGSGARSALDVHEELARLGAMFDTEVTADATVLTLTTLARLAKPALSLLADCVVRPRLAQADFDRVRQLRLNRLVQLRDLPPAVADRALVSLLYGSHPYGHLALGTSAALSGMSPADAVAFHSRTYSASCATLIAVGDMTSRDLVDAVQEAFGDWQAAAADVDAAPGSVRAAITVSADRSCIIDRPGSAQSELRIGRVAAARDTPDYYVLLVLNMILGGQFVSRLNLKLREEKGYTYGARTAFDFRRGRGPFVFQTSVHTDVTGEAIVDTLVELQAIGARRPPSEHALDLARAALTRGYPRNFETPEQIARAAIQLALYDLPDDYFTRFVGRVRQVDRDAVARAAGIHLDPADFVMLIVGDEEAARPTLTRAGLPEPVSMPSQL